MPDDMKPELARALAGLELAIFCADPQSARARAFASLVLASRLPPRDPVGDYKDVAADLAQDAVRLLRKRDENDDDAIEALMELGVSTECPRSTMDALSRALEWEKTLQEPKP